VGADEATRHHWKLCRWCFLSQQGLRELPNPRVTFARFFSDYFPVGTDAVFVDFSESTGAASASESTRHLWKVFRWWFPSQLRLRFRWLFLSKQGLRALPNQSVTFGRFFGDDFPVGFDSVFVDFFWVKRGWQLFRIHASPLKVVSVMISESTTT